MTDNFNLVLQIDFTCYRNPVKLPETLAEIQGKYATWFRQGLTQLYSFTSVSTAILLSAGIHVPSIAEQPCSPSRVCCCCHHYWQLLCEQSQAPAENPTGAFCKCGHEEPFYEAIVENTMFSTPTGTQQEFLPHTEDCGSTLPTLRPMAMVNLPLLICHGHEGSNSDVWCKKGSSEEQDYLLVEYEPVVCPGCPEGICYPGLHQK